MNRTSHTMTAELSAGLLAIAGLQHAAGTAEAYENTLDRIFNAVLLNQDDMGLDDSEAIDTLRTLELLRADLRAIATDPVLASLLGCSAAPDATAAGIPDEE